MEAVSIDAFRDAIVYLGARPMAVLFMERHDGFRGPFHSWRERDLFIPGVELHAAQMRNLPRGLPVLFHCSESD